MEQLQLPLKTSRSYPHPVLSHRVYWKAKILKAGLRGGSKEEMQGWMDLSIASAEEKDERKEEWHGMWGRKTKLMIGLKKSRQVLLTKKNNAFCVELN